MSTFGGAGRKFKTKDETVENLGWFFSVGLTKCSISAIVNSLKKKINKTGITKAYNWLPYSK